MSTFLLYHLCRLVLVSAHYSSSFPRILHVERGQLSHWPSLEMVISSVGDKVLSISLSPDGQRIVSGLPNRTIRVWNATTGEMMAGPFTEHTGSVQSVGFSPDGQRIVSGSHDRTIRVWNATTGEMMASPFTGHTVRFGLWHSRRMASASSQALPMKQFVCGTPRPERRWQARLQDTHLWSYLWHSRQMASASSQDLTMKRFVCGTPRRERQWQAHLLDIWSRSRLWHSRRMASASSQALSLELSMEQFVCGTPRRERQWRAHLLDTRIRSGL